MSSNYYDNSTFYNLIHNAGSAYWLASRYVYTDLNATYCAGFGLRFVNYSGFNGNYLFGSDGTYYSSFIRLRPVVSLKSNIRLSSGDGSEGSPYEIAGQ